MTSNQRYSGEVRNPMPDIEQLDIGEERARWRLAMLEAMNPERDSSKRPKIQKVPSVLKSVKVDFNKYFEPRLVALGPFHHANPKFQWPQQMKHKFAALFARENKTNDEALVSKIKEEIDDLKTFYYPEDIKDYNDDKLAWMFFVDGSAVLYAIHYGMQNEFKKLGTKADHLLLLDLLLLENQIPYRVLRILIQSAKEPQKWENSIAKFLDNNLITNMPSRKKSQRTEEKAEDKQDYSHLLQRLRDKHLTGQKEESSSSMFGGMLLAIGYNRRNRKTFRGIKELKALGINVEPSNSNNLKNISFYCNFLGSLKMPCLLVDDSTASKFMNLIALEMCPDFDNDFALTSYLSFMDSLIYTTQDVNELRVTGMLHNYLASDKEVADLFNTMSRDLVPDQDIYSDVMENIQNYCNNSLTTSVALEYYTHFSRPWSCITFFGAIMGLVFSAIQAFSRAREHDGNS